MTVLGAASILADIPKPVRSRITQRLAEILTPVAPVFVGLPDGYAEELPRIYVTPGRETIEREYGYERRASEYSIAVMVDVREYAEPEYELVDRLIAGISRVIAAPDNQMDSLIESIALTGTRPGYREDQGNTIGAELSYTISYAADPADPDNAI